MSGAPSVITVSLQGEAETIRLGEDLALALRAGDCLALHGDLGAGKSTLARAFIRAMANDPWLEVPSPTFTIIQTYDLRIPVAHLDLYRLSDVSEIDELGIDEMLTDGICLVEWPDIAGDELPPASTITLRLEHSGEDRTATIEASEKQAARISRVLAIRRFLAKAGYPEAKRRFLSGDASSRAYETVEVHDRSAMLLMDWPPSARGAIVQDGKTYAEIAHIAQNANSFVAISAYLRSNDFSAPEVLSVDFNQGILLIEDLGRQGVLDDEGRPISDRYIESVRCLARLHELGVPPAMQITADEQYDVPVFDAQAMKIEVSLLVEWYLPFKRGAPVRDDEKREYFAIWDGLIASLKDCETGLLLRDFHSPNIIWQPEEQSHRKVGLIDFQDAMVGPTAYDLASIIQDARVTIEPSLADTLKAEYLGLRAGHPGFNEAGFLSAFAIMSAQRNCKLAGIWVRLMQRDGKPGYMKHMPRTLTYLRSALEHDSLAPLKGWCVKAGVDFDQN
jgi:tRNA threonylcarbamoyl adenosine modification protein YjeE